MAVILFTAKAAALAAVPAVPPGQDLEAQAERFRQEYSIEKRSREQKMAKALIEYEEKEKAANAPGVSFVLHRINLTGATIFSPDDLSFVWKPYLNRKVNFNDLNVIVRMLKRAYKDLGYLTTTAYLPPQNIEGGMVEIRVVEGKLGQLSVEGNKHVSTPAIARYFHTYKGEVLDMGQIEKDVMRLNQNRDLNVTSVLSPGENPQTVDVTLKATDVSPFHVSIGTDNQGNRLSGRFRRLVTLDDSNLTGHLDNLSFNGAFTDLSSGEYVSYQTPVGTYGAKVGFDAGYFEGKLGQEFKQYDIVSHMESYDPNVSFELKESQDFQMNLRSGINIEDIYKKESTVTVTEEKLRVPYLALDMIKSDPYGQTYFSPQLSFGAPGFLNASGKHNSYSSRPEADDFFTKYNQYITRNQAMPWGTYMQIRSQFQAATHTLPTSEQIQLGGESSVRGYPEGDFLADIGGDVEADWYFPSYFIPASWRWYGTKVQNDVETFAFYDMGGGSLLQTNTGERHMQFLASLGGGIRIRIKNNMYLKLEWAIPLGDRPVHGTGPSTFDISFQAGT